MKAVGGTRDFDHFIPRSLVFGGVVQDLDKVAAELVSWMGVPSQPNYGGNGRGRTAAPPRRRPLGVTNGYALN